MYFCYVISFWSLSEWSLEIKILLLNILCYLVSLYLSKFEKIFSWLITYPAILSVFSDDYLWEVTLIVLALYPETIK